MKLIDLLVRELPKHGGWPDGAHECFVHCDTSTFAYFYDSVGNGVERAEPIPIEGIEYEGGEDGFGITRDQYESALAASQKPAWNGDGLPPVGCECEWQDKNTKQWQPVTVVYASEWVTVVREINKEKGDDLVEVAIENYGEDARLKFRTLRSEEDKKRYAAIESLFAVLDAGVSTSQDAIDVYDAIAAGKIPGVKLED